MIKRNTKIWPAVGVVLLLIVALFGFVFGWKYASSRHSITDIAILVVLAIVVTQVLKGSASKSDTTQQPSNEHNHQ